MTDLSNIESTVKCVLDEYCAPEDKLAIGVSGGADSMCLLSILMKLHKRENLLAVHVQHGIRGEHSLLDAQFVERYCKDNGVPFMRFDADIPAISKREKISVESAARNYRKEVFSSILSQNLAKYVLLAHNADDQTESVLMHVFRGSGIAGLVGMSVKEGDVIRPLLTISKSNVRRYVEENDVPYSEDLTNGDVKYSRNFIRHEVLPPLREKYDVDAACARLACLAREDEKFINQCVSEDDFFTDNEACSFGVNNLTKPYALASRYVLRAALKAGLSSDFEKKHVDAVIALGVAKNGSEMHLPHGYVAVREYELITIYRKTLPISDCTEFVEGITPFADGYISVLNAEKAFEKGSPVFDGDKIPRGAVIRFRQEGDVFTPYGGGTKKLKEYFIDEKVPARFRAQIPLICDGKKVLCVCGMEISDEIKVDESTQRILKFLYFKE